MIAWALPGGGANGGVQWGMIEEHLRQGGPPPDIVYGISVGTLNGNLIVQDDFDPTRGGNVWRMLRNRDVYRGGFNVRGAWRVLRPWNRKFGFLDMTPLRRMMAREIDHSRLVLQAEAGRQLRVGVTMFRSGTYVTGSPQEFSSAGWLEFSTASAMMPVIMDPAELGGDFAFDGGVRNQTPLSEVVHSDATQLVIFHCNDVRLSPEEPAKWVGDIATRTLEILLHEAFLSDLREFRRVNEAMEAGANLPGKRHIPVVEYQANHVPWSSLDFSPETTKRRLEIGRQAVQYTWG